MFSPTVTNLDLCNLQFKRIPQKQLIWKTNDITQDQLYTFQLWSDKFSFEDSPTKEAKDQSHLVAN